MDLSLGYLYSIHEQSKKDGLKYLKFEMDFDNLVIIKMVTDLRMLVSHPFHPRLFPYLLSQFLPESFLKVH